MQPVDVSWLVRLRWAAAVLFLLLALAARSVFHILVPPLALGVVWGLQILSNVALGLRVRTVRTTTVAALMALDTVLLTVLLALSGGPSNPFSVLFLVDVALGAVVLTPALTWALLGLALLCFGALFLPMPWSPGASLGHAEWEHIQRVLTDAGGNVSEAARRLGLHRKSLQRKLQKHPPRR